MAESYLIQSRPRHHQRQLDYYGEWYYEGHNLWFQDFGSGYKGVINRSGDSEWYNWRIMRVDPTQPTGHRTVASGRADSANEAAESVESTYADIAADDAEKRRERYLAVAVPERRPDCGCQHVGAHRRSK